MASGRTAPKIADRAHGAEADDKAGEDLESDVTGQHVGEQTNRQADRTGQERDDLDHAVTSGISAAGTPLGTNSFRNFSAVTIEAVDDHGQDHQHRKRERHDDVAGDGEEIREHPEEVGDKHKHEQGKTRAGRNASRLSLSHLAACLR